MKKLEHTCCVCGHAMPVGWKRHRGRRHCGFVDCAGCGRQWFVWVCWETKLVVKRQLSHKKPGEQAQHEANPERK